MNTSNPTRWVLAVGLAKRIERIFRGGVSERKGRDWGRGKLRLFPVVHTVLDVRKLGTHVY